MRSSLRATPTDAAARRHDLARDGALTIEAAVQFSGIGRTRLFELTSAGLIPFIRAGRRRLIPRRGLVEYLAERLVEPGG